MNIKGLVLSALVALTAVTFPGRLAAQTAPQVPAELAAGIDLYGQGQWREAVVELRRYLAASSDSAPSTLQAEAHYWIASAELSAGEYEAAVQDFDQVVKIDPRGARAAEAPYQKSRALYYLGRYDQALILLSAYAETVSDGARTSAALYWMGECLYALGRLDDAQALFSTITAKYTDSSKFEAASYRLALIDQKNIESELLKLLKWSHEESLKTVEEYQRRERSYEQAIVAYQKRIAEMLKDTRMADLEKANDELEKSLSEAQSGLAAANAALAALQGQMDALAAAERVPAPEATPVLRTSDDDSERIQRLLALKASALNVKSSLLSILGQETAVLPKDGATEKEAAE